MKKLISALMRMRQIKTERLTLEPQVAAHAEEMFVVLSDQAIYEYENAPPVSLEWLRNRFLKLESRQSADGREQWLNWVIQLPDSRLIGYVQATVCADQSAMVSYELASAWWGRGLAYSAVSAVIAELEVQYQVPKLWAVLKRENHRSKRLLQRLCFELATSDQHAAHGVEPDEILMRANAGSASTDE